MLIDSIRKRSTSVVVLQAVVLEASNGRRLLMPGYLQGVLHVGPRAYHLLFLHICEINCCCFHFDLEITCLCWTNTMHTHTHTHIHTHTHTTRASYRLYCVYKYLTIRTCLHKIHNRTDEYNWKSCLYIYSCLLVCSYICVCLQADGSFNFTETTGAGKCPYDPRHNSTFVYVGKWLLFLAASHREKAAKGD